TLVQGHLETLESFGIPTFVVSPSTIAEVQHSLIELGEAVGEPKKGEELAAAMAARLAELTGSVQRSFKPRVWLEVWNDPFMTAGPGSFMHELVELAGGENIAADAGSPWPVFSEEVVIERDPQVIILTNYNLTEALNRPAWQGTSALQNGHVYEVNADLYARRLPGFWMRWKDSLPSLMELSHDTESMPVQRPFAAALCGGIGGNSFGLGTHPFR
ncbi:MAG: helical backbone metal receptor, partial [Bacillota bacterium]|nr:helical backbone metal receptor [Bacillota bacterium]